MVRPALKWLAITMAIVAGAGALAVWIEHRVPLELPTPSGPFAIGRTSQTWDELSAWIWYPAGSAAAADKYLPDTVRLEWEHQRPRLINLLTRDLAKVRSHSAADVPVATVGRPYPVLIMRGSALNFSSLAEDLASHGYVVVDLEIPSTGNPELCAGSDEQRQDCATKMMSPLMHGMGRALDHLQTLAAAQGRFTDTLDLNRVGVFGYSFGGAQAAQFCSRDARCKAGVDIDGRPLGSVIESGIQVPFMFLLSDHLEATDATSLRILGQIQAIYDHQPPQTRLRVFIRGAHHFTFSDDGALLKSTVFRAVLRVLAGLRIGGRRQVEVTSYAVRTFFDAHLKNNNSGAPALASAGFPELVVSP
jgi:dienelactone hydrolase